MTSKTEVESLINQADYADSNRRAKELLTAAENCARQMSDDEKYARENFLRLISDKKRDLD